jgi:hypothetical protein
MQTLLRFKPRMLFFSDIDDIKFVDWTVTNQFARFWYYADIHHSSIPRKAILKAINKSPDHRQSSKMFEDDSNDQRNQFDGFVLSHTKSNHVTLLHIHSFVISHTNLQSNINTIVTCILTSRNHIWTNRQDCLLQLMQLIQYQDLKSFFHGYHQLLHWRRCQAKVLLSQWFLDYGI